MKKQAPIREELKRTEEGKWLPYGQEALVMLGVKIEKKTKERLNKLVPRKEKGKFLREAITKALDEYEKN